MLAVSLVVPAESAFACKPKPRLDAPEIHQEDYAGGMEFAPEANADYTILDAKYVKLRTKVTIDEAKEDAVWALDNWDLEAYFFVNGKQVNGSAIKNSDSYSDDTGFQTIGSSSAWVDFKLPLEEAQPNGMRTATAKLKYKHKQYPKQKGNSASPMRLYYQFFLKNGQLSGDVPNWFDYWRIDGAVPGIAGFTFYPNVPLLGAYMPQNQSTMPGKLLLSNGAAKSFGAFDLPPRGHWDAAEGIDLCQQVTVHERQHQTLEALDDAQKASDLQEQRDRISDWQTKFPYDTTRFTPEADAERPKLFDFDGIPAGYERQIGTDPFVYDTFDICSRIGYQYKWYADEELDCREKHRGAKGYEINDWAIPGRMAGKLGFGPRAESYGSKAAVAPAPAATVLGVQALQSLQGAQAPTTSPYDTRPTADMGARFGGPIVERALDEDKDGAIDVLRFEIPVASDATQTLVVEADLATSEGGYLGSQASVLTSASGAVKATVSYRGLDIRRAAASGPYLLMLTLSDVGGVTLDTASSVSQAYASSSFESTRAALSGTATHSVLDTDSDGLKEALIVRQPIAVINAGSYRLEAEVADASGKRMSRESTTAVLGTGATSLSLRFNGDALVSGAAPSAISRIRLYDSRGVLQDDRDAQYLGSAYAATKFGSGVVDLQPIALGPPFYPVEDEEFSVYGSYENIGRGPLNREQTTRILLDGELIGEQRAGFLPMDWESEYVTATAACAAGEHVLTVITDALDEITEVSESNNSTSTTFTVEAVTGGGTGSGASITGTVTAQGADRGIGGIDVDVYALDAGEWYSTGYAVTDADGAYRVTGLPEGTYRVGFKDWVGEYSPEYFDDKSSLEEADGLLLAAGGSSVASAKLASTPYLLGGRVVSDQTGSGVAGVGVALYADYGGGYWGRADSAYTDTNGDYRFYNLAPGTYRIGFEPPVAYEPEFYNDASDVGSADEVPVEAGAPTIVNASIASRPAAIEGTVTVDGSGAPAAAGTVSLYVDGGDGYEVWTTELTDARGHFAFYGLTPGNYRLGFGDGEDPGSPYHPEFYRDAATVNGAQNLNVADGMTVLASMSVAKDIPSIKGVLTNDSDGFPVADPVASLYRDEGSGFAPVASASGDSSGSYAFYRLSAGTYRLELGGIGCDYEYYNDMPDIDSAKDLQVVEGAPTLIADASLADEGASWPGTLEGTVTVSRGSALEGALVEAYRPVGNGWSLYSQTTAYANGAYYLYLPGGVYRIRFSDPSGDYQSRFFDGQTDIALAKDVRVGGGVDAVGISAVLPSIDEQPPTVACDIKPAYTGPGTIRISASDSVSGVRSINYRVGGGVTRTVGSAGASIKISEPGTYTVAYSAVDKRSNASAWVTETTVVSADPADKSAPGAPITPWALPGRERLYVGWSDPTGDFTQFRMLYSRTRFASGPNDIDGQTQVYWGNGTSCVEATTYAGTLYCSVFARDAAGNWSDGAFVSTSGIRPRADVTPPAPVTNFKATRNGENIAFSWVNPASDFLGVRVLVSPFDFADRAEDRDGQFTWYEGTAQGTEIAGAPELEYFFTAFVQDAAGNWSARATDSIRPGVVYPASLRGAVTSGGEGLVGVTVTLSGSAGTTTTVTGGAFRFTGLSPGTYSVTFTKVGYGSVTIPGIVIKGGETTMPDVSLAANPVAPVDTAPPSPPLPSPVAPEATAATSLSLPSVSPSRPTHGKYAIFTVWLSPGTAATQGTTNLALYRYETTTVRKKVGRKLQKVKVKYWRLRATKTMAPTADGRLSLRYKMPYSGKWKMVASYSGTPGYAPSTSATKSFTVK